MDIVLVFIAAMIAALVIFLVYYLLRVGRDEAKPLPAVKGAGKGSVISVHYNLEKGRSIDVTIHPERLTDAAVQRYEEEAARAESEAAGRPVELDFRFLNDYVEGRLNAEQEERTTQALRAVYEKFRPYLESEGKGSRLVASSSRPPEERRVQEIDDADVVHDDMLEQCVRVLSLPAYDVVLATYVAERLGLTDRVRRVLPSDDEEALERYQTMTETLSTMSDRELLHYALEKEPQPGRFYKRKDLGAIVDAARQRPPRKPREKAPESAQEQTLFSAGEATA